MGGAFQKMTKGAAATKTNQGLRRLSVRMIIAALSSALVLGSCQRQSIPAVKSTIVWHDEFDGPPGSRPDPTKWAYDLGDGSPNLGWGNNQLQRYTDSISNVFLDGSGHLVIRARRLPSGVYTSGRITTKGRFSFMYGRVEARIKIPYSKAIWPAFWMLGDSFPTVPWPNSGEIDIMENFGALGSRPSSNRATLHGPGYAHTGISGEFYLPANESFALDFHVFALDWQPGNVLFLVDKQPFHQVSANDPRVRGGWVFNAPFFILLSVAIGGFPAPVGYPNAGSRFPQDMIIDYVRVYQYK